MSIRGLISPPVFANAEKTQQAKVLHFITWSLLLVADTQYVVFFLLLPQYWPRWLAVLLTINFTLPPLLLLNHRAYTRLAGALLISVLWLLTTVTALTAGGIHALAVLMFIVSVFIAGLLFSDRGGVIAGIVFSLTTLGLVLLEREGTLPSNRIPYTAVTIWMGVAMALEFITIFQFLANRTISVALEQAKEREQRYREVFETTSNCIFLVDVTPEGECVFQGWNPVSEEIAGMKSADGIGKTPEQVFPADIAHGVTAHYKRCVAQGVSISYDETITSRHGRTYYFHTTLIPVRNAEGRIFRIVGVAHDITERKQAEDVLRRSRDELELRVHERTAQLEKVNTELQGVNQELEAFSYSVSHDLRRPLRTVTGFTDLLMSDHAHELSEDAQNLLTLTRDSALQMDQLIEALLRLSHVDRQTLVPRPVNLNALVQQTLTELQPERQGRNVDIRVAELPECTGDKALLRQVFVNLLSNSMKYTRNRPVPVIEVSSKGEDGEGMATYFVRDNGVGFDMRYADKLFGVFQRLHSAQEFSGTGVGLSIVRRIIHRHGGRIWAEAAVDKGATFYFTLPRVGSND